jgi:hypothetical protein
MIWVRAFFTGSVIGLGMVGIETLQLTIGYQAGYLIGFGLLMTGTLILLDHLTK